MTSGFNIASDITKDARFNDMMGFSKEDIQEMMEAQEISREEQEKLFPVMKENYDGYQFCRTEKERLYNSNMTLYFLNEYVAFHQLPEKMVDVNIASDYAKIGNMLKLCKGEKKLQLLSDMLSDKGIISDITEKFNPEVDFGDKEMVSMLYYLGYLTIGDVIGTYPKLVVPNRVMRNIYADYFLKVMESEEEIKIESNTAELATEMLLEGKMSKMIATMEQYLNHLSNRDFQRFDEKYVKLLFYCLAMSAESAFWVKSEMEVQRSYPDILLVPKDTEKGYHAILIEFKYLKKNEKNQLKVKMQEAKEQVKQYVQYEEIQRIENLHCYAVVAVVDKMHVEEIKE